MAIVRSNVVIPDQYAREIIEATVEESAALRLCRRVSMGTGRSHLPVMATLPSGGWINPRDTGRKGQTQMTWEDVILTAEEVATIVTVPEAVVDDAQFDIFGEVRPRLAEAFGALVDAAVFFGDNAPATFPAGGLVAHATAAGNAVTEGAVAGHDVSLDISDVMGKIEDDGFVVGGFAARPGIKAKLRGLRTTTNELLFQPSFETGTPPTIYGESIYYARNGGWDPATAELVAGDWQYAVIGVRQDITFKVLTEATFTDGAGAVVTSLAETDQVALRCVMRLGFAIANPVTRLQPTEAQRSPFAVLSPAA